MINFTFKQDQTVPELTLVLPASMEGTDGSQTLIALTSVFDQAMIVAHNKGFAYGPAWRHQGWMGNFARMMSKLARLKHMCWREHSIESAEEPVSDNAIDLINITGFFIVNRSEGNQWGTLS